MKTQSVVEKYEAEKVQTTAGLAESRFNANEQFTV